MSASSFVPTAPMLELLREAQEWRLIGLLFERPRGDWWKEVAKLAEGDVDPKLQAAAREANDANEGRYLSLLGPGGAVSAREAGYRKTADPAEVLSSASRFYEAFAYCPRGEDPLDHVSVEAGFIGWLKLKQAYALACGNEEGVSITDDAARKFMREHLACIGEPLAAKLAAFDSGHLELAARELLARAGPRPLDVEGDWVPEGLRDCTLACGLGTSTDSSGEEIPPEFTAGLPLAARNAESAPARSASSCGLAADSGDE